MISNFSKKIALGIAIATAATAGLSAAQETVPWSEIGTHWALRACMLTGAAVVMPYAYAARLSPVLFVGALAFQAGSLFLGQQYANRCEQDVKRDRKDKLLRAKRMNLVWYTKAVAMTTGVVAVLEALALVDQAVF